MISFYLLVSSDCCLDFIEVVLAGEKGAFGASLGLYVLVVPSWYCNVFCLSVYGFCFVGEDWPIVKPYWAPIDVSLFSCFSGDDVSSCAMEAFFDIGTLCLLLPKTLGPPRCCIRSL